MKKAFTTYLPLVAVLLFLFSCSTRKNTWLSRNYQTMTTKYNVYFNGTEALKKGINKIEDGLEDDYSKVLPVFTYADHDNLKGSTSDMERALEKGLKGVKKHSIKKKPKYDAGKMRDPNYREWYEQEEFNPMVPKSYLLMGQATFYKGEFLESVGVFNYVKRHFPKYPEFYDAQLWMARAYAEMGWLYEAENVLNELAEDETFPSWKTGIYSQVKADILIKQEQYQNAVPFLKAAINAETKKDQRRRLTFILAQIYQYSENFDNALATYQKVLKMSPPYEMAFNTRIRMTEVFQGSSNSEGIQKALHKMLKDEKNTEFLDQIYYAIANIELESGNEEGGIEYLKKSIETSKGNDAQKARSLILLGDLYYNKGEFRKAQPLYSQAAGLLEKDDKNYDKVESLSKVLNQMAQYLETIETQDSLIRVANLTEAQRTTLINGLIKQAKFVAENPSAAAGGSTDMNITGQSSWYFYNTNNVMKGKAEFRRIWGNRTLEDNWRRSVKDLLYADVPDDTSLDAETGEKKIPEDQTPEYYLKNVPLTPEKMDKSKDELAIAYVGAGTIYLENLKGYKDAESNFKAMLNRMPDNVHAVEAKYGLYKLYEETGRTAEAENMKQEIIHDYPNSKYAVVLNNPNFAEELKKEKQQRDSLYQATYQAYMKGDYAAMKYNVKVASEKYPGSDIEPNFMFMDALATSKTASDEAFVEELNAIKKKYPNHEVVKYVDNILELMGEGLLPTKGETGGPMGIGVDTALVAKSAAEEIQIEATGEPEYTVDFDAHYYYVIIHPEAKIDKNNLLFELSRFNFNKFLVKDFDISFIRLNRWYNILIVDGFDGAEEAIWYQQTILNDGLLNKLITDPEVKQFIISEENFKSMAEKKNPDSYLLFYNKEFKELEKSVDNPYEEAE